MLRDDRRHRVRDGEVAQVVGVQVVAGGKWWRELGDDDDDDDDDDDE